MNNDCRYGVATFQILDLHSEHKEEIPGICPVKAATVCSWVCSCTIGSAAEFAAELLDVRCNDPSLLARRYHIATDEPLVGIEVTEGPLFIDDSGNGKLDVSPQFHTRACCRLVLLRQPYLPCQRVRFAVTL